LVQILPYVATLVLTGLSLTQLTLSDDACGEKCGTVFNGLETAIALTSAATLSFAAWRKKERKDRLVTLIEEGVQKDYFEDTQALNLDPNDAVEKCKLHFKMNALGIN
jgi:hypothetical protein